MAKYRVLASYGKPAFGKGKGHLLPQNNPWEKGSDGSWQRLGYRVEERFPGSYFAWVVIYNDEPLLRCHGKSARGLRRYKTAAAAMLSVTGDNTVFATSPWNEPG